ncbi:MAG: hypothetical protein J6I85_02895 [Clostridia bacterium]|nr:hypothetical protein [Clostridia bacterium]
MSYNIIFEDNTEIAESEAMNKGYRKDVIVIIDNRRYRLYITDMIRLHQDFDSEVEDGGIYQNEPNTIIVKEVTKEEIERTIKNLVKEGFFDNLGYSK